MITLKKYKMTGADMVMALIFVGMSAMGITMGFVTYQVSLIPALLLFISGGMIGIAAVLPLTGLLWVDSGNNIYVFPNPLKYQFQGETSP